MDGTLKNALKSIKSSAYGSDILNAICLAATFVNDESDVFPIKEIEKLLLYNTNEGFSSELKAIIRTLKAVDPSNYNTFVQSFYNVEFLRLYNMSTAIQGKLSGLGSEDLTPEEIINLYESYKHEWSTSMRFSMNNARGQVRNGSTYYDNYSSKCFAVIDISKATQVLISISDHSCPAIGVSSSPSSAFTLDSSGDITNLYTIFDNTSLFTDSTNVLNENVLYRDNTRTYPTEMKMIRIDLDTLNASNARTLVVGQYGIPNIGDAHTQAVLAATVTLDFSSLYAGR